MPAKRNARANRPPPPEKLLRLSMVMIARNERENVRDCFASFWEHVDEVVLCDTGSTDGTVDEAISFASERDELDKLIVGHFKWCDDFAAARNHAHSLATGNVHVRSDLDERVVGGDRLREVAALLIERPEVTAINAPFPGGPGEAGTAIHRLWRAPVVWTNPTYEEVKHQGETLITDRVQWLHMRSESHGCRDVDIALKWAKSEPGNFLPWWVAARERAWANTWGDADWSAVIECCDRCLSCGASHDESVAARACHADARVLKAEATFRLGDWDEAGRLARDALKAVPEGVESVKSRAWLVLAGHAHEKGLWREAFLFAKQAGNCAVMLPDLQLATLACLQAQAELEGRGDAPPGLTLRTIADLERKGILPPGLGDIARRPDAVGEEAEEAREAFITRLRFARVPGAGGFGGMAAAYAPDEAQAGHDLVSGQRPA